MLLEIVLTFYRLLPEKENAEFTYLTHCLEPVIKLIKGACICNIINQKYSLKSKNKILNVRNRVLLLKMNLLNYNYLYLYEI